MSELWEFNDPDLNKTPWIGKPDKVELRPFNFSTLEEWGYKIKNNYITDLEISFEAGKLTSLRAN